LYKLYKIDEKLHKSFINGAEANMDSELYDGFIIDMMNAAETEKESPVNASIESTKENAEAKIECIVVTINGNSVMLPKKDDNYIFADMLNYTNIDPSKPEGDIVLLHNGREASYLNLISEGDIITIKWGFDQP